MSQISKEELNPQLKQEVDRIPTAAQQAVWDGYTSGSSILSTSNRPVQYAPRDYYEMDRRTIWENYKDSIIGIPNAGANDWSAVITIIPYKEADEDPLTQIAYCKGGSYTRTSVGTVTATATWGPWSKYSTFSGNYNDLTEKPDIEDKGRFAVCSTTYGTANKSITVPSFTPEEGVHITVKFQYGNTHASPKLYINDSFTYSIYQRGITGAKWVDGETVTFVYSSGAVHIVGGANVATLINFGLVRPDNVTTKVAADGTMSTVGAVVTDADKRKWNDGSILKYNGTIVDGGTTAYDTLTEAGFYRIDNGTLTLMEVVRDNMGIIKQTLTFADMLEGQMFTRIGIVGTDSTVTWTPYVKTLNQDDYDELFQSVSNGKTAVANAITDKGVATSTTAEFATMATNIAKISGAKSKSQQFSVTASGSATSVETNVTLDAGFPVEYAIIVYHDFWPSSIEKTGAVAVYVKSISLTNPVIQAGGYYNNTAMRGVVIPNHLSNANSRTAISGNTVIVRSTYYNQVALPSQTLNFTVYAFG